MIMYVIEYTGSLRTPPKVTAMSTQYSEAVIIKSLRAALAPGIRSRGMTKFDGVR